MPRKTAAASLPRIVIVGSSGHASVVIDVIEKTNRFTILGLIDSFVPPGMTACGYPILGDERILPSLIADERVSGCFIAVGDNWKRFVLYKRIVSLAPEIIFISAIHPSAQIARNVRIGRGTVLMAGTVVNSNTTIGDFCILNTNRLLYTSPSPPDS